MAYCGGCQKAGGSCPVCRCQATAHLKVFFPGEVLPNALVAAAPPAAKAQELKVPLGPPPVLALPDAAYVDAERRGKQTSIHHRTNMYLYRSANLSCGGV